MAIHFGRTQIHITYYVDEAEYILDSESDVFTDKLNMKLPSAETQQPRTNSSLPLS